MKTKLEQLESELIQILNVRNILPKVIGTGILNN